MSSTPEQPASRPPADTPPSGSEGSVDPQDEHVTLRTWEDAERRTREFEVLLQQYDGDFQKATDAQLRGEKADPNLRRGSANSM